MPVFKKRNYAAMKVKRAIRNSRSARARFLAAKRRPKRRGQYGFNVHMYKRFGSVEPWTDTGDGTTVEDSRTFVFSLSDVANSSELTSLYDQYKISAVVIKFQLINNPNVIYQPGSTATSSPFNNIVSYPKLWYYRDYDDSNVISLASMREVGKAKCMTLMPNKIYSVKIKPSCLNLMSGTTTQPTWPRRLDCSAPTQTHYGLKCVLDYNGVPPPSGAVTRIQVEKLYYLKMYNSR